MGPDALAPPTLEAEEPRSAKERVSRSQSLWVPGGVWSQG